MQVKIGSDLKDVAIIDTMTIKEVKRARQDYATFTFLQERIAKADDAEYEKISKEIQDWQLKELKNQEQNDQYFFGLLSRCTGLSQDELENMRNVDALVLFSEIFKASTELPRKNSVIYG